MNPRSGHTRDDLARFRPTRDAFVGVDSDGCVFPTMELKQQQCFHPLIVSHWRLEPAERWVRECAEFVNLYSRHRGRNRFPCLLETMDLLRARPEAAAAGVRVPRLDGLRRFVASGVPLSNDSLARAAAATGDPDLAAVLAWSRAVNEAVARTVKRVAPFPWARESLEAMRRHTDAICVSQTPTEALLREWADNGLTDCVALIAGQELGTKLDHLRLAAVGKYPADRILMIGDAPGDREAARGAGALFFPIVPGREAASWECWYREGYPRFRAGAFAGDYERDLIAEFDRRLPATPPWDRGGSRPESARGGLAAMP